VVCRRELHRYAVPTNRTGQRPNKSVDGTGAAGYTHWGSCFRTVGQLATQTHDLGLLGSNEEAHTDKEPRPVQMQYGSHTNKKPRPSQAFSVHTHEQSPGLRCTVAHRWTNPGPLQVDYGHKHEGQNPLGVLWPRTQSPGPFRCTMAKQMNCRGLFMCSMATQITNIYTCTHVCV
jgi:hypothetical protein